jgi:hypothetical protein
MSEHDNGRKRSSIMTIRLYEVRTVVKVYTGHRDVVFRWFACRELGFSRWPHAELIAGYDELDHTSRCYAEHALDKLFDKTEADTLVAYLAREHGDKGETTIKEVNLPFPGNIAGYGATAVGGSDDFYMLDEEPAYSLPFRVWGYFDLEDCEPLVALVLR